MDAPANAEPPPDVGLSEAEAARRLAVHGPNRISPPRLRRWTQVALGALGEPMFLLLLAAVGLYFVIGDTAEAMFLFAGAAATIGLVVLQETRSERALAALRALAEPTARVLRDSVERRIPAAELVPGDVVLLGEGGRVPADAELIGGDPLTLDESILTGESLPVVRRPDGQDRTLFAGTLVLQGQGVSKVVRTGQTTRVGEIGVVLAHIEEAPTRLQRSMRRVVANLGVAATAVALAVLLLYGLARGDWLQGALSSITIGVALIPEEFPMVVAVFLALGGWRLAQERVLVRRAAAIETLGAVSVLCVDKTGTLTENRMAVAALWRDDQVWEAAALAADPVARRLLGLAADASALRPVDPMDRAIRALAVPTAGPAATPLRSYPLTARRLAFVQAWPGAHGPRLAAKGAPEAVFDLCRLDAAAREPLERAAAGFATRGLRVLAVASADAGDLLDPEACRFTFEGLVAFADPVRADVPPALAQARAAGVRVVMITGDYPATALEIGRQAGVEAGGGVLSGTQLAALDEPALRTAVRRVSIFARIVPEQKLRLVRALQAEGAVVGMFGDGVNDGPALEAADVGVAMGMRGADVAREAADLVLLDDRFASVVAGIAEGRRVFANLRAALAYVVVVHVPIAGLAILPLALGEAPVLFPLQVVLLELVIDPICALVFESRPSDPASMKRPPRNPATPLFGRRRLYAAGALGLVLLAAVMGLHLALLGAGLADAQARAATLIALVTGNFAVAGILALGGAGGRARLAFWATAAISAAMMAGGIGNPWLAGLFQFAAPPLVAIAAALATGLAGGVLVGAAARRGATT